MAEPEGLPRFYGGAVGYLGYDMVRFVEELPDRHPQQEMPDSALFIPGYYSFTTSSNSC